jgi:hypothetical protein
MGFVAISVSASSAAAALIALAIHRRAILLLRLALRRACVALVARLWLALLLARGSCLSAAADLD